MAHKVSHLEDEHSKLSRILDFRFPHKFKVIGLSIAIMIFALLLGSKFYGSTSLLVKDVLRTLVLLFMLIASLSKDRLEDELNRHLRFQSYVIAFVITTVYSISIPLIAVLIDFSTTKLTGDGQVNFHEVSAFEVLFILLGIQLLFFETLKRLDRAE